MGRVGWVYERGRDVETGHRVHTALPGGHRRADVSNPPRPLPSDIPKRTCDKNHWRDAHSWSPAEKGGRPSRVGAGRVTDGPGVGEHIEIALSSTRLLEVADQHC